ncbi:MAG: alpha/beta fold hydrolase [Pseudomonadota bacterium]
MPTVSLPGADIHYEVYGPHDGFPLLLLAPGGLRSHVGLWRHTHECLPRPFPDPTVEFARGWRVIAVDQRNAGRSRAEVTPADGWDSYASDHLGVLDHLGVDRFHVMGACIGSSFALKLAQRAPTRVVSAVLQAPIGWTRQNAPLRGASFQAWVDSAGDRLQDVPPAHLQALRQNLFGSEDFVFSVSRDFVRQTDTPLLVLAGDDVHHPLEISEEIVCLARHAQLVRPWKGTAHRLDYISRIAGFLHEAEAVAAV